MFLLHQIYYRYLCFYNLILVRDPCGKERLPNHLWTVLFHSYIILVLYLFYRGRRHRDCMVVSFTTTCAISTYCHSHCEFERVHGEVYSCSWRGVLDTTLCDKVCQWLATGQWFSLGIPVSSTNKTDHHDITEILLKVALNTIKQNKTNKRTIIFIF